MIIETLATLQVGEHVFRVDGVFYPTHRKPCYYWLKWFNGNYWQTLAFPETKEFAIALAMLWATRHNWPNVQVDGKPLNVETMFEKD
jgi:hypothetical protein